MKGIYFCFSFHPIMIPGSSHKHFGNSTFDNWELYTPKEGAVLMNFYRNPIRMMKNDENKIKLCQNEMTGNSPVREVWKLIEWVQKVLMNMVGRIPVFFFRICFYAYGK